MSSTFYSDLPEDPERIFLVLEERFRRDLDQKTEKIDWEQYFPENECLEYMRRTSAAAQELSLAITPQLKVPSIKNLNRSDYFEFRGDIDHFCTVLQIRHARRDMGFTVRFDNKAREIISHHLKSIKEIFLKLDDVEDWKREALLNKLTDLEKEINRDRFQYKIWAAFIIESAGVIGAAADKMESVRRLIDSISYLLYGAKQNERQSLPAPTTPKQIEPPRRSPPSPSKRGRSTDMDDDIPF
jgi:hypothetical protein